MSLSFGSRVLAPINRPHFPSLKNSFFSRAACLAGIGALCQTPLEARGDASQEGGLPQYIPRYDREVYKEIMIRLGAGQRSHQRCANPELHERIQVVLPQSRHCFKDHAPPHFGRFSQTLQIAAAAPVSTRQAPPPNSDYTSEEGIYDCVVVGGGISGLCTAQALETEHKSVSKRVLLTEGRDRVGGNITSVSSPDGYRWEEGPNSFQPNDSMLKAAVDAGMDRDLVFGDPKAPRYVWWEKKLRPTPSGPDALTFDLLTFGGKIRAGLGAIGVKKAAPGNEETVEQFVRRNLGKEAFERLIEPFCSGVYAGDPAKLSMKAAFGKVYDLERKGGSIIGGVIKLLQDRKKNPSPPRDARLPPKPKGQTVGSFKNGLQSLPQAIAAKLQDKIRTKWSLREIEVNSKGEYVLLYNTPDGVREITARSVALTVPAYVAADLVRRECPDAASFLKAIDYPPVAAVSLSYPTSALKDDRLDADGNLPGFGQLHPRTQGIVTLGTIYTSSLFPGRAPEGYLNLLCYIGGTTNRSIEGQSEQQIVNQVDKDLREMLIKPDAPKPKLIGLRIWPKAIPQFNVGHQDLIMGAKEDMQQAGLEGVLLGGNYVAGVALGKCVEYAYEYANQISEYLKGKQATAEVAPTPAQDEVFFV